MNEWEFELLEEKAPAESVTVSGVEVKKGRASGCVPAQAAISSISR